MKTSYDFAIMAAAIFGLAVLVGSLSGCAVPNCPPGHITCNWN